VAKVKLLDPSDPRRRLERYELIGEIATGGMATVFLARRSGAGGFQRFVAIKRLHPHLQGEPEFVEMFLDEARLAALIHHPNVVPILEVGESDAGYYLVMEYVEGDTLSKIVARSMSLGQMPPRPVILRVMLDALAGLHAAHELKDERGHLLGLVHRDCSPQNILVGVDGSARITDFGVARASARLTSTAHGKLKGKLAYMAPEQTRGDELDRRTDLFAMGIILWEVLCGKRLFKADNEAATLQRILVEPIKPPSQVNADIPSVFDAVALRALDRSAERRFQSAADFADALEAAGREAAKQSVTDLGIASPREVASYVQQILGQEIGAQRESVRAWLAQSDSGQEVIIAGAPARASGPTSAPTKLDGPAVPRYEVAADVTMRFALEGKDGKKDSVLPPPSSPKPSSTRPAPDSASESPASAPKAPPRPPPPAKPSQPTLLGQGPPPRHGQIAGAPIPAAGRPPDPPATVRGIAPDPNALPDLSFQGGHADDVGDDAVTMARRTDSSAPAAESMVVPQVKTARGLAPAAPAPAAGATSLAGLTHTPRMPLSPREAGVPDAKIQIAKAALSAQPPVIEEAQPIAEGPAAQRSPSAHPRTLVSGRDAIGSDLSAGAFTPGSMTLPTPATGLPPQSYPGEPSDTTVVHTLPKRGVGRYVVVLAAFVLVFAGGLLFLKYRDSASREVAKSAEPEGSAKKRPPVEPTQDTAKVPPPPPATGTSSAVATSAPTADPTPADPTGKRPRAPKTAKPVDTGKPVATSKPTSQPTAKPTSTGEDLTNPYR
jgi:eukaryotic-like serine/threonine-protein kinase